MNDLFQLIHTDKRYKLLLAFLLGLIFYSCYAFTNHYTFFPPKELHMLMLDHEVPFLPWTQWIYHTEVPFIFFFFLSLKKTHVIQQVMGTMAILIVVSCTLFIFFPSTYPRENFIPLLTSSFHDQSLLFFWQYIDRPTNCFPSLHVGTCYLLSFACLEENLTKGILTIIYASLIAISTLTTKQHYVVDIISGFLLAALIWYGFRKRIKSNFQNI